MNTTTRTIAASLLALTLQAGVAAVFPVTVLASEASDEAAKAIREPLSAKNYATERTMEHTNQNVAAQDIIGQSDSMKRALINIALETYHVTNFPEQKSHIPVATRPRDW
ncbi:hypothetical protein MHM84_10160 [Halomonas sp. McH1-25]|uniref:hypothetical protein n=1 Tax=unclassified Halomonas TaxID=2609666 RepID=UPI001EF72C31|nr:MULTISPECIES: hypothetical protein [unclassified Halomonas]MCG7600153.1 hypothetical protein [Halomonas sp. McH1-25]MCP1341402.1 hypothetical protein [Halomonas sp. FL8]MCP1359653.1 hypothetical protein [Halomonas sp. BBD45]MCP1367094.1 hypothetical protein [Halomonas sp. BBD48]